MANLLALSIATAILVMIPGPNVALIVANSIRYGLRTGATTALGVTCGNAIQLVLVVVGMTAIIQMAAEALTWMRWAGVAYLIYLGLTSFFAGRESLTDTIDENQPTTRRWFLQGFINNVLNPKGTLFYLGISTMVITPETTIPVTVVLVAVMMAICATFWLLFVMTLDQPAVRRFIDRSQQTVNRLFGVLLVTLGLRVALIDR